MEEEQQRCECRNGPSVFVEPMGDLAALDRCEADAEHDATASTSRRGHLTPSAMIGGYARLLVRAGHLDGVPNDPVLLHGHADANTNAAVASTMRTAKRAARTPGAQASDTGRLAESSRSTGPAAVPGVHASGCR
jgi:hypothetical protein